MANTNDKQPQQPLRPRDDDRSDEAAWIARNYPPLKKS
jgi:hypothetical protein